MKRLSYLAVFAIALFAVSVPLRAQVGGVDGGCTDSPENPTAILALAGTAGAGLAVLRTRLKARKKK